MTSRVLITGGTGSLGHALTESFLADGIDRLVIFSRDEYKQAQMQEHFRFLDAGGVMRFFLGDVRDPQRLRDALWSVDTVIHAAALKRVDATSYNPSELVKTNTLGTLNVIHAAIDAGVPKVLLISSDKAVEPANPYGASKMLAEHIAVASNATAMPRGTRVSVLRYGNVLDSRGSVLHVWREHVRRGRMATITDPDMTRFVLTLEEAAGRVRRSLEIMKGGEIFVPVLPSCRLHDLFLAVLPGHVADVTGLRPGGEKLHEKLVGTEEARRTVEIRPDLWAIVPSLHPWSAEPPWTGKEPLLASSYTSLQNPWQLSVEELTRLVAGTVR